MRIRTLSLTGAGIALALLGASCSSKTNVSTGNTNITVGTNTSATLTNSNTTGSFTTNTSTTGANTVTLTSSGANPKNLTVTAGTTVTFVNNDSVRRQIASDPHPSHTNLPGFDALSGIQPGGTFTFTFATRGTFGFHDHLDAFNSGFNGSIIVQ